jgi:hypothetical protein
MIAAGNRQRRLVIDAARACLYATSKSGQSGATIPERRRQLLHPSASPKSALKPALETVPTPDGAHPSYAASMRGSSEFAGTAKGHFDFLAPARPA